MKLTLTVITIAVAVAIRYALVAWAWPSMGPKLMAPCPMPTELGAWGYALVGAVISLADLKYRDARYARKGE